jgi:hypothetical protein
MSRATFISEGEKANKERAGTAESTPQKLDLVKKEERTPIRK